MATATLQGFKSIAERDKQTAVRKNFELSAPTKDISEDIKRYKEI